MIGYNTKFFADLPLPLPVLSPAQKKHRAPLKNKVSSFELKYTHFSIVQNKTRRLAFFAATNIDGKKWNALVESNKDFTLESRLLATHQTGNALYNFHQSVSNNDFDKGHITKFQDPQWGKLEEIKQAAADTLKFTNCLPQHQSLNRGAWKSLEDYIIKKFTKKTGEDGGKICVFAGPVLMDADPFYIDAIGGKPYQVPVHFWKVVVYKNRSNNFSAVGFLMSQKNVLFNHHYVVEKKEMVRGLTFRKPKPKPDFFSDFVKAEPYQVRIDFIEQVTGLQFNLAALHQPYTLQQPTEIIYQRIEIPVSFQRFAAMPLKDRPLHFTFQDIRL